MKTTKIIDYDFLGKFTTRTENVLVNLGFKKEEEIKLALLSCKLNPRSARNFGIKSYKELLDYFRLVIFDGNMINKSIVSLCPHCNEKIKFAINLYAVR
jgi:hypothetical protein